MIALAVALCRYHWHKRVKRCDEVQALRFMGRYTRIVCWTCGTYFWQMPGLFRGRR